MTNNSQDIPTNMYNARRWVKGLYSMPGVTWEKLAQILGVPAPTLSRFARGGKLPRKHKRKLISKCRKLHDMPVKELRWAIEHRKEY